MSSAREAVKAWLSNPENQEAYNLSLTGQIHEINYQSKSAGPGERTEIFFQGCSRGCKHCFSPETWDPAGGKTFTVADVIEVLYPNVMPTERITICGGEPFMQADFLFRVLFALRSMCKELYFHQPTILLYTGYDLSSLRDDDSVDILQMVDMLITGEYIWEQGVMREDVETDFIGSFNQKFVMLINGMELFNYSAYAANSIASDHELASRLDSIAWMLRNETPET